MCYDSVKLLRINNIIIYYYYNNKTKLNFIKNKPFLFSSLIVRKNLLLNLKT